MIKIKLKNLYQKPKIFRYLFISKNNKKNYILIEFWEIFKVLIISSLKYRFAFRFLTLKFLWFLFLFFESTESFSAK